MIVNKSNPCWCPLELYVCNWINSLFSLIRIVHGAGEKLLELKRTMTVESFWPFVKKHMPQVDREWAQECMDFVADEEVNGERSFAI